MKMQRLHFDPLTGGPSPVYETVGALEAFYIIGTRGSVLISVSPIHVRVVSPATETITVQ
jgi:hypothetical protein